jgi:UDP-glucose 4-epimerase
MKAAVIGATGYIGKHLAFYLQQQGWQVSGYGKSAQTDPVLSQYTLMDVSSKEDYRLLDTEVELVFYFAGITGTIKAYDEYEKYTDVNEKGLLHLLDTLRSRQSKARVVFPSTRLVYRGGSGIALKEDAAKEFKTIYALSKWFGEQVLQQYAQYFNIPYTIFRICVPYGNLLGDAYSYGTTGFFMNKAKAGQDITLYGDGSQRRSFTHVADICKQVVAAVHYPGSINQVFNTGGENFSLKEMAEKIAAKYHVKASLVPWPPTDEKMESGDTVFDDTKLRALTAVGLDYSFDGWLQELP